MLKKKAEQEESESTTDVALLMSGIDLENRTIEIRSEVNETLASIIARALITLSGISKEPITIYFSSGGGSVHDGLAIYDFIRACPCDVNIIASGIIASMGFIIFLAGDSRIAMPNTTFMMHSISYSTGDVDRIVRNHEVDVIESKRLNNVLMDIMAQRTKQPKRYWYRKILNTDFYMNIEEAQLLGVISTPEKKAKNDRKKV